MTLACLSFLIGMIAGMRPLTAAAAVSWAAFSGRIDVADGLLAFLAYPLTPWIISVLAVAEIAGDKLASSPSRKVAVQFVTRLATGALPGAAGGAASGWALGGAMLGVTGSVVGTYGGAAARSWLAGLSGSDFPGALLEDFVAVGGASLIVWAVA